MAAVLSVSPLTGAVFFLTRIMALPGGSPPAMVQVVADGTDANSSGVALAYVQGLVGEFNGDRKSVV